MALPLASHISSTLLLTLLATAKPKVRSTETHDKVHVPEFKTLRGQVQCLLIGDSMFERFKTTGKDSYFGPVSTASSPSALVDGTAVARVIHPDGGADVAGGTGPAPSSASILMPSISDPKYPDPSLASSWNPQTGVFNAGCGGDTIRNVIHRLTGTILSHGLLELLLPYRPRYIFLCMGTNDLGDGKKPLSNSCLADYSLVLQVLVSLFPGAKICVCGLNPKERVKRVGVVEESNRKLEQTILDFNMGTMGTADDGEDADAKVDFLPSDPKWIEYLEDDGVHLNEAGYALFGQRLWDKYEDMKRRGHSRTREEQAVTDSFESVVTREC